MTVLANLLTSDAIHWARNGVADDGSPTFASPVAITCRWEAKSGVVLGGHRERRDAAGSVAYTSTDVAEGDWLKLGSLSSSTEDDPREEQGAREVVSFEKSTAPLLSVDPIRKATVS